MGCSLSSCSCSKTVPKKEDYEADPSLTTRSKSLTNRSTDINTSRLTPTNHIQPNLKKLNLTNLTQLQSDRSFTSRIQNTTNSELKDKVSSMINVRNGKSFMMLLKEINFSFKIIQKLDKLYSNSLITNPWLQWSTLRPKATNSVKKAISADMSGWNNFFYNSTFRPRG